MLKTFRYAAALAALGLFAAGGAQGQTVKFTFASTNGPQDFSSQAVERWKTALAEKSNGEIELEYIGGGALGGDQQLLQQLGTNEIQMHVAGPVVVHQLLKPYQCMEAEFVYADEDHGYKVWNGPLGKEVSQKLEEQYGITIVGVGLRGARHLTANRAVAKPDDLKGVKVRVTNALRSEVFAAYGALPGPLPVSELYGGLRQGVFDAQENPISTIWGDKFYEVQSHVNLTGHVQSYFVFSANKSFVDGLSAEHRKIFDETLAEAIEWMNEKARTDEASLLEQMKAAGVKVVEPDVAAFRAIAQPIVAKYAEANCRPGILDDINAVQ